MKIQFNFPGLADALSGWTVCKPTLQELSLSFGIISLMTRKEMFLKCWFTCHPTTQHDCWPEKVSLNSVPVKASDYIPIKVTQSIYQSILLRQLKNHWTNRPKILYLEILQETLKLFQFWFKTNTVYILQEGLSAFLNVSEHACTHTHTHTYTHKIIDHLKWRTGVVWE
jgi:hypothetical protein